VRPRRGEREKKEEREEGIREYLSYSCDLGMDENLKVWKPLLQKRKQGEWKGERNPLFGSGRKQDEGLIAFYRR
jgi:hypothetical protein